MEQGKRAAKSELDRRTFRDGAVYLFRRSDYKKPIWQIRVKIPGTTGYIHKSSGTADEHVAFKIADGIYLANLAKAHSGSAITSKRASDGLGGYIRDHEGDRARLAIRYRVQLAKRLVPIWQSLRFADLDTAAISNAFLKLREKSRKPAWTSDTLKRQQSDLKAILTWCCDNGYLNEVPRLPKVSGKSARRPHLDHHDWDQLRGYMATHLLNSHGSVKRDRVLVMLFVLVIGDTGIRLSEAHNLRWGDLIPVQDVQDQSLTHVALRIRSGKTGARLVVASTPEIRKTFAMLHRARKRDLQRPNADIYGKDAVPIESFIFCGIDGKPIKSFKKSFRTLLKDAGVLWDPEGKTRTPYSLRHTYATHRLEAGVDAYHLANNMGTSVTMIERHYGHTSNIGMINELTKPARAAGSKASADPTNLGWLSV